MIARLQRCIVATAAQPFAAKVAPARTILRTVLTRRTATANRSYRDPKRGGTRPETARIAIQNWSHRDPKSAPSRLARTADAYGGGAWAGGPKPTRCNPPQRDP